MHLITLLKEKKNILTIQKYDNQFLILLGDFHDVFDLTIDRKMFGWAACGGPQPTCA